MRSDMDHTVLLANYIGRCMQCVLAMCRVKEGLSRSEQLVGYIYSAPLLDMAYCLA